MKSILYICTHNRCRSILSEVISNALSGSELKAYSAGSSPVEEVHPLTLHFLAERGYATEGLRSKSWDEFTVHQPDIVITVCDSAANETCPVWFGDTITCHWSLPDPSKLRGSDQDIAEAFMDVIDIIEERVKAVLALELDKLSHNELQDSLHNLIKSQK